MGTVSLENVFLHLSNINTYILGQCAAEAVFCYTSKNSHHLKAQVT
jgi:hypothetical protein